MKHITRKCVSAGAIFAAVLMASAADGTFGLQQQVPANPDNEPAPVHPVPHDRQVKWMETEFYAFFHYGMNTFTGLEWGNGDENEATYAPTEKPDPRQWLEAVQAAGMKGGIAVVKHHDGFCLWPTETTTHSIANAGNENGKTNIPEAFAAAAKDLGMKYGFYVSPWDRNSAYYGDGTNRYVKDVFLRQCAELSKYGDDQFEMWFDGANGGSGYYGGANTTRTIDASTYYDVPNLRDSIHTTNPNCVMWGVGDEARWIGNEAGWAGETNWCYGSGTSGNENATYWKAGESDAKATSGGWFWHSGETVKDLTTLWKFYMETVGRNATLILNFPPDQRGKLPDADVTRLKEFGDLLKARLGNDLAQSATVTASATRTAGANRNYEAANLTDGNVDTYWATNDGELDATITFTWQQTVNVHLVSLQEYIRKGQRVKAFTVEVSTDGGNTWTKSANGVTTTTIGYKRIIPLNGSTSTYGDGYDINALRIHLTDGKACPLLHTIAIY
jgi:alpha-L-fucosidase